MRMIPALSAAMALVALAACSPGNPAMTDAGPRSTSPVGAASEMPQSPNSVPVGAAVTAPLTSASGNIEVTDVRQGAQGASSPDEALRPTQAAARRRPPTRAQRSF